MPPNLFGYHLSPLDLVLPVLDHTRLFLALHAHVLVSSLILDEIPLIISGPSQPVQHPIRP